MTETNYRFHDKNRTKDDSLGHYAYSLKLNINSLR